jgi:hypothetical protein
LHQPIKPVSDTS